MYSYWEKRYWFRPVDFTIVGAGLVGLLSSIYLIQKYPKATVRLLEREAIPKGASTRNAGFACFGTVGELQDDLKSMDEQDVINTIKLRYQGLQLLRATVPEAQMDFNLCGGHEVFTDRQTYSHYLELMSKINEIVEQATGLQETFGRTLCSLPNMYRESIFNKYEGQLNPVKLIQALRSKAQALGIEICSGYTVDAWAKAGAYTTISIANSALQLETRSLILTTNAFTERLLPNLDIQPKRNQVLVSQPIGSPLDSTFHYDQGYVYFRNIDNRVLIGGARNIDHKEESTSVFGSNEKIIHHLTDFARMYISPEFEVAHQWSGIIATGRSKSPIVKWVSDEVLVAARLGGMGVAIGAQVARQVVDLIE